MLRRERFESLAERLLDGLNDSVVERAPAEVLAGAIDLVLGAAREHASPSAVSPRLSSAQFCCTSPAM